MNKEKMIKFFKESIAKEKENEDGCTYWQTLDVIDGKEFAIVLGWQDGFDTEDGYELCMKLAYLPTNSLMSEYSVDWLMPYDEKTGDVDDTEICVGNGENIEEDINWLLKCYEKYAL